MFLSCARGPYVPETIVPVIGIDSWSLFLVSITSPGNNVLKVVAIVKSYF